MTISKPSHFAFFVACASIVSLFSMRGLSEAPPAPNASRLTASQIVERLTARNAERSIALQRYQGRRSYQLEYVGFPTNLHAEMVVNMTYKAPPADKEFTVVSESGSKWIVNHIFKRLLDSEREALDGENRAGTALDDHNYNFTLLSDGDPMPGCPYVLGVEPKIPNKFLYRGRIWVSAGDFAVCRIEAEPAKNPSFWIKKTEIHHAYEKVGDFWLPADNKSVSNIRLGGVATLTIRYQDYRIQQAQALQPLNAVPMSSSHPAVTSTLAKSSN
jgi:hypothetical protein